MKDVYVAEDKKTVKNPEQKDKVEETSKPLWRKPEEYSEVMRRESRTKNPLAAFVVKPRRIRFETQDPEEHVLLLLRKHGVTNLGWAATSLFLLVVPFLWEWLPLFVALPMGYQVMLILSWYMVVVGYAFEKFLSWYFNVYIVTDERIIDYDFYSLLYKRVSEAKIDRIEDVTYEMGGALMNLFNYGTVFIQTAGELREFDFVAVPKPETVVKLLNELTIEEEREKLEGRVR